MRKHLLIAARTLLLPLALLGAPALAQEALVKQNVESRFSVKVDGIAKTPYGLYEVRLGDEIMYTDEKVTYLLVGSLIDSKTRENVTEERKAKLSAIKFEDLPFDSAIKTVRGNGKRTLAVFADPNCGFCKRFEQELATLKDVTIYTFLYPILDANNRGDSTRKARAIWCSKDRSKAWLDLMLKGSAPSVSADCDNPLARNLELGQKMGISGTPTSFTSDGQRVVGARFASIQRALDENKKN